MQWLYSELQRELVDLAVGLALLSCVGWPLLTLICLISSPWKSGQGATSGKQARSCFARIVECSRVGLMTVTAVALRGLRVLHSRLSLQQPVRRLAAQEGTGGPPRAQERAGDDELWSQVYWPADRYPGHRVAE